MKDFKLHRSAKLIHHVECLKISCLQNKSNIISFLLKLICMKLFKCNKSETLRQVLNISSFLQKEAEIEKIIYEKNK